jgi:hypothetical protein
MPEGRIIPIFPALSHTVFLEFSAYCGPFSHAAHKDSPLIPLPAEIGTESLRPNDEEQNMKQISFSKILALAGVVFALGLLFAAAPQAQAELVRHSTSGDLFFNFYVPPVGPGSVGAKLYPCPRPTPPMVGHTYITYEPLMPSEFLYKHHRKYKTFHEDAPKTRTSVHWR